VPLLRLPEPYDFELSTERYRAFGADLANLWQDGSLHRVVGAREVRIEAAKGGVRVEPLDAETRPVVRKLLGAEFDLEAFYAWARRDPVLRRLTRVLAGFRPPISPEPFESLVTSITAQQVSLHAAFAIRNRLIERFGRRVGQAYAFPTADRLREASHDDLLALGFSNRKAESRTCRRTTCSRGLGWLRSERARSKLGRRACPRRVPRRDLPGELGPPLAPT
jgi:3-methyladenine DNA glycosylase/8-oxoguanine DNA glycosylase